MLRLNKADFLIENYWYEKSSILIIYDTHTCNARSESIMFIGILFKKPSLATS